MDIIENNDVIITINVAYTTILVNVFVGSTQYSGKTNCKNLSELYKIDDVKIINNCAILYCKGKGRYSLKRLWENDCTLLRIDKKIKANERVKELEVALTKMDLRNNELEDTINELQLDNNELEDIVSELRLRNNELEKLICSIALSDDGAVLIRKLMEEQS